MKTIGILGGMGPEASVRLCQQIIELTPAQYDQENLPFILHNLPQIPDRTKAIIENGENPIPKMLEGIQSLQSGGADFIIMPCNTAHYFIEELQDISNAKILSMIEETAKFVSSNYPDSEFIGLLATTGTVMSGIYQKIFRKYSINIKVPNARTQEDLVMDAIYGKNGIKAKHKEAPRKKLERASRELIEEGAQIIIGGCTEICLALDQKLVDFVIIDPSKIIALAAIKEATLPELEQVI